VTDVTVGKAVTVGRAVTIVTVGKAKRL